MSAAADAAPGRLSLATLARLPPAVQRPRFDPTKLGAGIVHIGLGAFHRAHQAVYTEDAIGAVPGDWGIIGVSLRRPDAAQSLTPQDCLYTLETRDAISRYRVMGVLRKALAAHAEPAALDAALASERTHIVTLTVTEKGYGLAADGGLDSEDPDIAADLQNDRQPASTLGWLMRGLRLRYQAHKQPLTIISCDNLAMNGAKLRAALLQFGREIDPAATRWIEDAIRFPNTMVDCVVPATDTAVIARVDAALGVRDAAPVQRETFSQWVIEDAFAGPRPAWDAVGAMIVRDVSPYERMKLHVLNAAHSALAYLGIPRGHTYVREAIGDATLVQALDEMVSREIAPALAPLDVADYWRLTKRRFSNPNIDHALAQIAEDGSKKLAVRVFPVLIDNARAGRPAQLLAQVVRAWLAFARNPVKDPQSARLALWAQASGDIAAALDDDALFPDAFRTNAKVRAAVTLNS